MLHICKVCGTSFKTWKTISQFCGRECAGIYKQNRITVSCAQCGKLLSLKKYRTNVDKSRGFFCDQKCYAKWQSEKLTGLDHYQANPNQSARWTWTYRTNRIKALERDNYECIRCGSSDNIHVHHKERWNSEDPNTHNVDNLESLCASCHRKEHYHERSAPLHIKRIR